MVRRSVTEEAEGILYMPNRQTLNEKQEEKRVGITHQWPIQTSCAIIRASVVTVDCD